MAKSKPQRPRRIWRTLMLVVAGVAVLLLVSVAAFVFNPFEGTLPELRDIVPRGVNFYLRKERLAGDFTTFPEPRFWPVVRDAQGFSAVQNGSIGKEARRMGLERVLAEAQQAFDQVRQGSGGFFDLMRDVLGRELIVAGYELDYTKSPPQPLATPWWCVYARVSWRAKAALGVLGLGFGKAQLAQNGVELSSEGDLLVVRLRGLPDPLYVRRYLDVVMVANNMQLLDQAERLNAGNRDEDPIGRMPAYSDGALARVDQWADVHAVDQPNVVEFVVEPNAFDGFGRFAIGWPNPQHKDSMNQRVLASFLNLRGWTQATGGVIFGDGVLAATGQIDLNSTQHTSFQSSFYTAEQQPRKDWLDPFLRMVPDSACAAAALRMPAGEFLHAMFAALEPDEQNLLNDAVRRASFMGEKLNDARDLIERLRVGFLGRTGFVFRRNTPDTARDDNGELMVPVAAKSPMPQVAWVFWLRQGGAPLVEELVSMLRTYYSNFGFRKVWHLKVPFAEGSLPEPVTEFTNPQIPATGEVAMIVFRDFFVLSNSGPLIKDIVRTRYTTLTGARSVRERPDFPADEELGQSLNGLIWIGSANLLSVIDDYLAFAENSSSDPDPEWMMLSRQSAEDEVRRTRFPQYPSKASMPPSLRDGDFEQAVRTQLRDRWLRERTSFSAEDRADLQQLRGLCQMTKSATVQAELTNNHIRYLLQVMADFR